MTTSKSKREESVAIEDDISPIEDIKAFLAEYNDGYVEDWDEISKSYRIKQNWTCEQCGVVLKRQGTLLHTHHIDRDKTNNAEENLQALCVLCHSKQEHHEHMKEKITIRDRAAIVRLRRAQGI